MTSKYNINNILDDEGFHEIIKERLAEWNGDVDDPQFIAIWSAADYRMKFLITLKDKGKTIDALMGLFKEKGFIPQYGVSGPPTLEMWNARLSPKGDMSFTSWRDNTSNEFYLTTYLTGEMRPLFLVCQQNTKNSDFEVSDDSRFVLIVYDEHMDLWDVFGIRRIGSVEIAEHDDRPIIRWSADNGTVLVHAGREYYVIKVGETVESRILHYDFYALDAALNEDGSIAMVLTKDRIEFIDLGTCEILSSGNIPLPCWNKTLSFCTGGTFYVLAGGMAMECRPYESSKIVADLRDKVELSNWSKHLVNDFDRHEKTPFIPGSDDTRMIDGNIILESKNMDTVNRCVIDPKTLAYELYSDCVPLSEPVPSIWERMKIFQNTIKEYKGHVDIDPVAAVNDGKTVSITAGSSSYSIRLMKKVSKTKFYAYSERRIDNGPSYPTVEISDTELGLPDDTDKSSWEERDDLSEYTDRRYNSLFIKVGEAIDDPDDDPYRNDIDPNGLNWNLFTDIDHENYLICHHSGDSSESPSALLFDGERIGKIPIRGKNAMLLETPYYMMDGDLYRLDAKEAKMKLIAKGGSVRCRIDRSVLDGDADYTLVGRQTDTGIEYDVLYEGRTIRTFTFPNDVKLVLAEGKMFYCDKGLGHVIDIRSGNELKTIEIADFNRWFVIGRNDANSISLAKMRIDRGRVDELELDIARMSAPGFDVDVFKSGHMTMESFVFPAQTIDVRGNKILTLAPSRSGNPVRPWTLTSHLVKKDGIKTGNTLIPDISRMNANVTRVDDGRYLVVTNGITEDRKKDSAQSKDWCPIMRLMDVSKGRMALLERKNSTEGQLYGIKHYVISESDVVSLDGGRYIVTEFKNDGSRVVISTNTSTGKQYPESGHIEGIILDSADDSVTVGLIEKRQGAMCIESAGVFDYKMTEKSKFGLNVPITVGMCIRYDDQYDGMDLVGYYHGGLKFDKAYKTCIFNEICSTEKNGIGSYIPLIIPVPGIPKKTICGYPRLTRRYADGDDSVQYETDVMLCTLHNGMIGNELLTKIDVPYSDTDDFGLDELRCAFRDDMFLRFIDGRYYLVQKVRPYSKYPDDDCQYRITQISLDGKKQHVDVVGPSEMSVEFRMAFSVHEGRIEYVRVNEDDCCEHCILGDDKVIPVPDGHYAHSLFRNDRVSVTYCSEPDFEGIIVTDGSEHKYIKTDCRPENVSDGWPSEDGTLRIIVNFRNEKKVMLIPENVKDTVMVDHVESKNNKIYNLGNYTIFYRFGLYGSNQRDGHVVSTSNPAFWRGPCLD